MFALFAAAVILTAMAASFKLAGILDWSWWFIATPVYLAAIGAMFLRK